MHLFIQTLIDNITLDEKKKKLIKKKKIEKKKKKGFCHALLPTRIFAFLYLNLLSIGVFVDLMDKSY